MTGLCAASVVAQEVVQYGNCRIPNSKRINTVYLAFELSSSLKNLKLEVWKDPRTSCIVRKGYCPDENKQHLL